MNSVNSMDAGNDPVVRSIDVGFGLVKFSLRQGRGVRFSGFPSVALPADSSALRAASGRQRNTYDVPAGDAVYEVGVDIGLAQADGTFGRDVSDDFYKGPIYEALTKGALRYMAAAGDTVIDVLVLGLPLNQFNDAGRRDFLINRWTGTVNLGGGASMRVDKVIVQAQPMGGYVALEDHLDELNEAIGVTQCALQQLSSPDDLDALAILVVDPGEHTLDWLLVQEGTVNQRASGAASNAGRHRVVRAVMGALSSELGRPLGPSVLPRINEAMRKGLPVKLAGVLHALDKYEPAAMAVVEDAVNRMLDGIRDAQDLIDLFVLVGGHPARYQAVLERRFPSVPVFVMPNAAQANVVGFQKIGEAHAQVLAL